MSSSYTDAIALVDKVFSDSRVLNRLGFSTSERQLMEETIARPAWYCFTLKPSPHRELLLHFSDGTNGDRYFIVAIANTEVADSFLLEDWLRLRGHAFEVSPCLLFTQAGTEQERLSRFVAFLEEELSTKDLWDILSGKTWVPIPYDWGVMK